MRRSELSLYRFAQSALGGHRCLQGPNVANRRLWERTGGNYRSRQGFRNSARWQAVRPFLLADIGEGIKEVQIIQWFVQPGARVEQFDKLCEVASDKAITEITSRFDGVVKKLHYEPEDMAQVGKPLCDIDIQGEISQADEALVKPESNQETKEAPKAQEFATKADKTQEPSTRNNVNLAIPAVRGLLKEHNLNIAEIKGTGKDGRVLKEDIHTHLNTLSSSQAGDPSIFPPTSSSHIVSQQKETIVPLTSVQSAMFKVMTKSLSIPHFLYTTDVDLTELTTLRKRLNANSQSPSSASIPPKLTALPFIIKALSLILNEFPLLNARLDIPSSPSSTTSSTPTLTYRPAHNIALAIDTPSGLLVPVLHNVSALTIPELSSQITSLSTRARTGKLTPADFANPTITVSNIGNIGGTFVAPIIVPGTVAILGIGRARDILAFSKEEGREEKVVRREVAGFCWSADHRAVDGAVAARAAERLRVLLEDVGGMVMGMR